MGTCRRDAGQGSFLTPIHPPCSRIHTRLDTKFHTTSSLQTTHSMRFFGPAAAAASAAAGLLLVAAYGWVAPARAQSVVDDLVPTSTAGTKDLYGAGCEFEYDALTVGTGRALVWTGTVA